MNEQGEANQIAWGAENCPITFRNLGVDSIDASSLSGNEQVDEQPDPVMRRFLMRATASWLRKGESSPYSFSSIDRIICSSCWDNSSILS